MISGFRQSFLWHSRRLELYKVYQFQPRRLCWPCLRPQLAVTCRTPRNRLAIHTTTSPHERTTLEEPDFEHLFCYTSGRWLWDEEQQLQDRYKAFDVSQLQALAAQAVGSDGCVSISKLAEGGFNKVLRLLMNDGKTVLARIPKPNAGPPFYTTASEVATMEFVSSSSRAKHAK